MQFGVHIFPTQHSFQPDELARAVEDRGLDSLWFSEHTHIPTRFLNAPGPRYPLPEYYHTRFQLLKEQLQAIRESRSIAHARSVSQS